ncbi:hypothetical protein EFM09_05500 [Latilactobacillus curvatus]|uniref:Uncharacterized protein n=1 Tax=Latilactobacillus curvatus TaxID=28038 RepID=A0A385AF47_LATCU|nr:ArpU family phage packaging/lysis transcriptional regulator [Latilactobacillus curvatus]AXN36267.1 hypothetical protein DT351_07740 [Latilactobacillus curvatus]AZP96012.1 hypothetical protein CYK59_03200 [Latilactobacillus curvatus]MCT1216001.1 hypothetical protein [Latilactobacillus curvatus]MCT3533373.1 hypothetical protein [Latilactobacillus curvatus]UTC10196.1 hypothetical protein A4W79_02650 [Latilactobacillus curvatus]
MWVNQFDYRVTTKAVKQLLKQYATIRRLAINSNHPFHKQARQELECIKTTLKDFDDPYLSIIKMCYLSDYPKKDEFVASHIGYGKTQYYKMKRDALLMFAERYSNQELLKAK